MAYASYVTELVDSLTAEEDPTDTLFPPLLAGTLSLGEKGRFDVAVRAFEIRLMRELGYEPELYRCLNCRSELQDRIFFLRSAAVPCAPGVLSSFPEAILSPRGGLGS